MHELLNTLYVHTQGAVLSLDSDTVRVEIEHAIKLRAPLLRLSAIVVFGNVTITPFLIHRCAQDGRTLVWLTQWGRFRARVQGPIRGNVLLRRAQHQALDTPGHPAAIARQIIAAKVQNSRGVLLRAARESQDDEDRQALAETAEHLARLLTRLPQITGLNELRGVEGEAARGYFSVFSCMVRAHRSEFALDGRTHRPPRDPTNSVLSFLYALVRGECEGALEGVGLDPQMGFLHCLRPGRPALALDLMEELRPVLADRLALTLINRQQLKPDDFEEANPGIKLTEKGRKTVLEAYEKRKGVQIRHHVLDQQVPLGLVPHVQAKLLARHLRDELDVYPPFIYH